MFHYRLCVRRDEFAAGIYSCFVCGCIMKKRKRFKTTEDILFYIGLCRTRCICSGLAGLFKNGAMLVTGCRFLAVTGLYCPACGGTRALNALLHGHVIASLKLNPAVAYGAAIFVWFMLSQTAERLSRHQTENRYEISESLCVCGAGSADGPVACKKYYKNCRSYVDTAA